jgi:hypothetical protein
MKDLGLEGAAWGLEFGAEIGQSQIRMVSRMLYIRRPVYARDARLVMSAVGILSVLDHDAGMEEGASDGPEEGGDTAGLAAVSLVSRAGSGHPLSNVPEVGRRY